MSSKKKLEEKHLKIIKEIQQHECNKRCFECDQRGPTYIDVTIGSFVCTSCGGLLRGINPPHRIKSVSMATFTPTEIAYIETRGNEYCKNIYLGKYDERSKAKPESRSDHAKLRTFMEQKYEQKRWYIPPEEAQKPLDSVIKNANEKKKSSDIKPLSSLLGPNANIQVSRTSPKQEAVTKKPVNNIFDLNSPTTTASSGGFADFNNAFTSSASTNSFDAFGDFTSGQPQTSAPTAVTSSGFANFSNMIVPSSTTAPTIQPPSVQQPTITQPPQDKYADLGDLFNIDSSASTTDNSASMWSSFAQPSSNTTNSLFGSPKTNQQPNTQQQSVFGTNHSSNPVSNSVFGGAQQQPTSYGNSQSIFGNNVQQQAPQQQAPQQQASAYGNAQTQNQFGQSYTHQNQTGFGKPGVLIQQQPQSFGNPNQQAFGGFPQQQTPFGANPQAQSAFPNQPNQQPFGNTQQTTFPAQQSYMGTQQTTTQSQNPFMPTAQPQTNIGNPFMSQQQAQPNWNGQQTFGQPQSMTTNPFTGTASQPIQKSTNPFF